MRGPRGQNFVAVAVCLLAGPWGACAQPLAGLWASKDYRIELTIEGEAVAGTFRPADNPPAEPGKIQGKLSADGQSFTATWTFPAEPEQGQFATWLTLRSEGRVLVGYRWTEETEPTLFSLHRADEKGEIAWPPGEEEIDAIVSGGEKGNPAGGDMTTGPGVLTADLPGGGHVEIILCEEAPEGQPRQIGVEFAAPKTLTAPVRFRDLPIGATLRWLWTQEGKTLADRSRPLKKSTGWHWHRLSWEKSAPPGHYLVAIFVNGEKVGEQELIVRDAGAATATGGTTTSGAGTPASGISTGQRVGGSGLDKRTGDDSSTLGPWIQIQGPRGSALLKRSYDRNNFQFTLEVTWTKPGVVVDTIGINAAPPGSFNVQLDTKGEVSLGVYAPALSSPYRLNSGWHQRSLPMPAHGAALVSVGYNGSEWTLSVGQGDQLQRVTLPLRQPASGAPIYLGDFPGDDDKWPDTFVNKHAGFTGAVRSRGFTGEAG